MVHPVPVPVDVPDFIADGVTALLSDGFVQQSQQYDRGSFGNWQLVLANEPLRVQTVLDRDEWRFGAGWRMEGTWKHQWFCIEAWMECLNHLDSSVSMTLEEQVEYVCQTWRGMKDALAPERFASCSACLFERQLERSRVISGNPHLGEKRLQSPAAAATGRFPRTILRPAGALLAFLRRAMGRNDS